MNIDEIKEFEGLGIVFMIFGYISPVYFLLGIFFIVKGISMRLERKRSLSHLRGEK